MYIVQIEVDGDSTVIAAVADREEACRIANGEIEQLKRNEYITILDPDGRYTYRRAGERDRAVYTRLAYQQRCRANAAALIAEYAVAN